MKQSKVKKQMKTVLYMRVSSNDQRVEHGLKEQEQVLQRYIKIV